MVLYLQTSKRHDWVVTKHRDKLFCSILLQWEKNVAVKFGTEILPAVRVNSWRYLACFISFSLLVAVDYDPKVKVSLTFEKQLSWGF